MTTIDEIANDVSAGYAADPVEGMRALSRHFAETVDHLHVPRMESDGRKNGAELAAAAIQDGQMDMLRAAVPDIHTELELSIAGNEFVLDGALAGTKAKDGAPIRCDMKIVVTVEDGKVTRLVSHIDPGAVMQSIMGHPDATNNN